MGVRRPSPICLGLTIRRRQRGSGGSRILRSAGRRRARETLAPSKAASARNVWWRLGYRIIRMRDARSVGAATRRAAANELAAARFARAGADGLWLVRATRDHLAVAWPALPGAVVWQVVCWDSHDAAVGQLRLTGRHRRATFVRLAGLRQ